jgi:hypothetical protein
MGNSNMDDLPGHRRPEKAKPEKKGRDPYQCKYESEGLSKADIVSHTMLQKDGSKPR